MTKPHRIAVGGIVIHDDAILLVRYNASDGSTYLVCPGGKLELNENVEEAVIREVREETGQTVLPTKVVAIEDLVASTFKCCKIWMLCEPLTTDIDHTDEAHQEGIIEVGWFSRESLTQETIYPPFVKEMDWSLFERPDWQVLCLASRTVTL